MLLLVIELPNEIIEDDYDHDYDYDHEHEHESENDQLLRFSMEKSGILKGPI